MRYHPFVEQHGKPSSVVQKQMMMRMMKMKMKKKKPKPKPKRGTSLDPRKKRKRKKRKKNLILQNVPELAQFEAYHQIFQPLKPMHQLALVVLWFLLLV